MDWIDAHSVDCSGCGQLVDERDCLPNPVTGEGSICGGCVRTGKYDEGPWAEHEHNCPVCGKSFSCIMAHELGEWPPVDIFPCTDCGEKEDGLSKTSTSRLLQLPPM